MPLFRLMGVEHLPPSTSAGVNLTCYGLAYSDFGAVAYWSSNNTSNPNIAHLRIENNTLAYCNTPGMTAGSATGSGLVTMPLLNLIGSITPTSLVFGFRLNKLIAMNGSVPVFTLASLAAPAATAGTNGTPMVSFAAADVLESAYYEVVLDLVGLTYTVYKNNAVFVAATALPSGITQATIKNYYWSVGRNDVYTINGGANQIYFTLNDIYILGNTGVSGDPTTTRWGDTTVKRTPMASASGGWIPSNGGAVIDQINGQRLVGTLGSPDILTPPAYSPLLVQPNLSAVSKLTLRGVYVSATPLKDAYTTGGLTAGFSRGGTAGAVTTLTPNRTIAPIDQKIGAITAFPDASAFTMANLAGLSIAVNPT